MRRREEERGTNEVEGTMVLPKFFKGRLAAYEVHTLQTVDRSGT